MCDMAGNVKIHRFKDGKVMSEDRIALANGEYVLSDEHLKLADELSDRILKLQYDLDKIYNQLQETEKEAQAKIEELESELEVKDNLLTIKNGLCKNELPTEITIDGYKCEIIQTEQGLYISRDRIYEIIDREKKPLKDRCAELEDRHQQDCITINQLQTTIDVLTTRYAKLKEMNNY